MGCRGGLPPCGRNGVGQRALFLFLALSLLASDRPAAAHPGSGIVVDAAGRVFFTDLKRVWRRDPEGKLTVVVPGRHSHEIRLAPDGNLLGEHVDYDGKSFGTSAWKLSADGALSAVFPRQEGFPFVFSAAVAPDGTAFFARTDNNRRDRSEIFRQRPGSAPEPFAGGDYGYSDGPGAAARFGAIGALAIGPDGFLYVTEETAVRRVAPDGRVSTLARGGRLLKPTLFGRLFGGRSSNLMGLTVDAAGTVYVANFGGRRVVRVSPTGIVAQVFESEGPWAPAGVTLARGDLYVLEWGTRPGSWSSVRVRQRSAGGKITTLAVVKN